MNDNNGHFEDIKVNKDRNELKRAQLKIQELERRLYTLEMALKEHIPKKLFDEVKFLNYQNRKKILITGGSGFVGSHLVDVLMREV